MLFTSDSHRGSGRPERRVLVVEDQDAMRHALTELIETREELRVSAATASAEEAVAKLDNGARPDLVVADVDLPGMSGIELTRLLHARWPDLPILVLSSHTPDRFEQPALAAGACGYLVKGKAARELVPTILEHLAGPAA